MKLTIEVAQQIANAVAPAILALPAHEREIESTLLATVARAISSGVVDSLAATLRGAGADAAYASVPEPGRAQFLSCPRYLPGDGAACTFLSDPRGAGMALGAVDR